MKAKYRGGKTYFMKMETKQRKAGVAILTSDKTDFKTKTITRDKEGPSNSTSGYLSKETQNTKLKRHTQPCVYCSIIYNNQDMNVM